MSLKDNYIEYSEYLEAQKTFMAILLYSNSETISKPSLSDILNSTKEEMFSDNSCKLLFQIYKNIYEEDFEIIGTKQFLNKVKIIASLESVGLDIFVEDIGGYWINFATINNWLNKIHKYYFKQLFKQAETEEEFNNIILEKRKVTRDMLLSDISDDASEILESYEEAAKKAIFTPYKKVNSLIGSLQGGDMIILAASSGCGKTCFMLNFAKEVSKTKKQVLIFSLEMPKKQLQQRIICSEANIDASKFRTFELSLEDKMKFLQYSQNEFKNLKIRIYKKQVVSMNEIRNVVLLTRPDIVFIDYLGLVNSYDNKSSYEKFSNISRDIKLLAMEADVPIVALHQLNREFQKREDKRPLTSDLRDSGKIEQDADMIWFLYRPGLFDDRIDKQNLEFILAKDRHGESNKTANLRFDGKLQRIYE